jgi:hypothetical protein
VPEKPFHTLADEFNSAADSWTEGPLKANALVTRYALLMRHCTDNDDQRRQLTAKLFDSSLVMLGKVTKLGTQQPLNASYAGHMRVPLDAMSDETAIGYVPNDAPRRLADVALDVLAVEAKSEVDSSDRTNFTDFAKMVLEYADKFSAAISARTYDTSTSQPVQMKPISLKSKSPDAP